MITVSSLSAISDVGLAGLFLEKHVATRVNVGALLIYRNETPRSATSLCQVTSTITYDWKLLHWALFQKPDLVSAPEMRESSQLQKEHQAKLR